MEIKFRWVGRNKKYNQIEINFGLTTEKLITGNVLSFFNHSNRGENGNCEFISEDLFTGLTDDNGTDIYKGDILNNGHGFYEVVWNDGAFFMKRGSVYHRMSKILIEGYVNVGNIHDNKELLNR